METVRVNIGEREDFPKWLGHSRTWLDRQRLEPCRFAFVRPAGRVVVEVGFHRRSDAEAFARQFGGELTRAAPAKPQFLAAGAVEGRLVGAR